VAPFWLDTTEVTADAFAACVIARACDATDFACADATYGVPGKGDHPINCVDWFQAEAFCRWKGTRLPTTEEWEWAARGGDRGTTYPWGNDEPSSQACWKTDGTCVVGSHSAGDPPFGAHDLAGNVWEWTSSESVGGSRIYRGGSWGNKEARYVRASSWSRNVPTVAYGIVGFRCARSR